VYRVVAFKDAYPEESLPRPTGTLSTQLQNAVHSFLKAGWKKIVADHLLSATFTIQTMFSYFLDNTAEGRSFNNFKVIIAMDNSSLRLFQRGFIRNIQLDKCSKIIYHKARCEPEMKSTASY
jgi:hypothetical protein